MRLWWVSVGEGHPCACVLGAVFLRRARQGINLARCAQGSSWSRCTSCLRATVCGALYSCVERPWFCPCLTTARRSLSRVHLLVRRDEQTPAEVPC